MPILEVKISKGLRRHRCSRASAFPWSGAGACHHRLLGKRKTTLLRCLNFLETPDEGEIWVNGKSRRGRTCPTTRFVRTGSTLVWFSRISTCFPVYGAGKYHACAQPSEKGSPGADSGNAMSLLGRVGLTHKADASTYQLSGGQQQRVAIAWRWRSSRRCCALTSPPAP